MSVATVIPLSTNLRNFAENKPPGYFKNKTGWVIKAATERINSFLDVVEKLQNCQL